MDGLDFGSFTGASAAMESSVFYGWLKKKSGSKKVITRLRSKSALRINHCVPACAARSRLQPKQHAPRHSCAERYTSKKPGRPHAEVGSTLFCSFRVGAIPTPRDVLALSWLGRSGGGGGVSRHALQVKRGRLQCELLQV